MITRACSRELVNCHVWSTTIKLCTKTGHFRNRKLVSRLSLEIWTNLWPRFGRSCQVELGTPEFSNEMIASRDRPSQPRPIYPPYWTR